MDLLGSILDTMDKPPTISAKEKEKIKKAKEAMAIQQQKEQEQLAKFKADIQTRIDSFESDEESKKLAFPPCDRYSRSVIHSVVHDYGYLSYSIGQEGVDRHIVVFKREYAPCEDELRAMRNGEEWNEEIAKALIEKRKEEKKERLEFKEKKQKEEEKDFVPAKNYQTKYQHIIDLDSAREASKVTQTNKQYGFVPSENKRDARSIEQTLADIKNRKKLKTSENKSEEC